MTQNADGRCPACDARLDAGDRFCERCGASLPGTAQRSGVYSSKTASSATRPTAASHPAGVHRALSGSTSRRIGASAVCGACGGAFDPDGYCTVCGVRDRPPGERVELDLSVAAAVSDQGRVHRHNEDAFHLEIGPQHGVAAVVCDGVSSATSGDLAAQSAARAAGAILAQAIADPSREPGEATLAAIRAANDAVGQVHWTPRIDRGVPSCTLVSALWREGRLAVGWIGDSRAYWLAPDRCSQLTTDDSWAADQVTEGLLTPEQAADDPRFHWITNWVGTDAPDRLPRVLTLHPDAPGRLVLCTDGLWNYAPTAGELATLVDALPTGAAPVAVARSLTDTALARGGRDNITVAVLDIDPADPVRINP